jgi:hypothetical protein
MSAGVAQADITPPRGYRMAGYFAERVNTGTKDPLLAKAIVFRQDQTEAALVFCDLVSVPREIAMSARKEASRRAGIPASNIAVAATHSHTGPLYHGVLRARFHAEAVAKHGNDPKEAVDYPALLVNRIADAVAKAQSAAEPVRLDIGTAQESRLAFNRRFHMKDGTVRFNPGALNPEIVRPAGPIDPEVGILFLRKGPGRTPIAGLAVFALHLDTVGGTEYSADYPFFIEDELRKTFGAEFMSIFGTGTCGDINHIDVTKRERAKTEAIGRTLAGTAIAHAGKLEPVNEPELAVASAVIEVPLQRYSTDEIAAARAVVNTFIPQKAPFLDIVRACKIVDLADNYEGPATKLEVQAFRLADDVALVTLPGEVFVELGLAIKRGSAFRHTFVVELANACPAYVPTRKAFAEGSYEVVNSRVASGGGEQLVETALALLKRLSASAR